MIGEDDENFDPDIIMHINSTLAILTQFGVGPPSGFIISGKEQTWEDFLGDKLIRFMYVETYMYLKVKLVFDPPSSSAVIESMKQMIQEYEWRLSCSADSVT